MLWRRRGRYPMSLLSFLCIACGILFMFGNVLLLHEGFAGMFDRTFSPQPQEEVKVAGIGLGAPEVIRSLADIGPNMELPLSALSMETRLRKLMEENAHARGRLNLDLKSKDIENHVMSVSADDLRGILSLTSRCDWMNNITHRKFVASGWTKAVYRGKSEGREVAIKTVDATGRDVTYCADQSKLSKSQCREKATHKVLKEIVLLEGLEHQNIIKVLGHCVPASAASPGTVAMVTELGETLDIIKLLQMTWEDRLRICLGLTRLLQYLATSPYGSVVLNDYRRQQFILVRGEVKLTDVDDMGVEEPRCQDHANCRQIFPSTNHTISADCVSGRCSGFNERKNIYNTGRHFVTFLLPHGAPKTLKPDIDVITRLFGEAMLSSRDLLVMIENLVEKYKSGEYLQREPGEDITEYKELLDSDLPGMFDYRCRYSIASTCTLSVFDQKEAETLCNMEQECKGFVLSQQKTWTGRTLVHFKNGIATPRKDSTMKLYIKGT